jgi:hypothetical protein
MLDCSLERTCAFFVFLSLVWMMAAGTQSAHWGTFANAVDNTMQQVVCFQQSVFQRKKEKRNKQCIQSQLRDSAKYAIKAELQRVDLLAFLTQRAKTFVYSVTHEWSTKPSRLQGLVFVLQLAEWYILHPNTPFRVSDTTSSGNVTTMSLRK